MDLEKIVLLGEFSAKDLPRAVDAGAVLIFDFVAYFIVHIQVQRLRRVWQWQLFLEGTADDYELKCDKLAADMKRRSAAKRRSNYLASFQRYSNTNPPTLLVLLLNLCVAAHKRRN